jgi:hypothetical protein
MHQRSGFRVSFAACKSTGIIRVWLSILPLMLSCSTMAQHLRDGISESTWLKSQTLVIVFPTFTVKHERINKALASEPQASRARVRADKQIARERSFSDSLMHALHLAFAEHYTFGPWMMMADTAFHRWRKENGPVEVRSAALAPSLLELDPGSDLLFLRRGLSDRQSGSNMAHWKFISVNRSQLHPRFPISIAEGSVTGRFVDFIRAFLGIKDKYSTVPELLKLTAYVARKTQREFDRFYDRDYQ